MSDRFESGALHKTVLCVCSANMLRSPTAQQVLGEMGYNTRSCGTEPYALIPVTDALVAWADKIVVMEEEHKDALLRQFDGWDIEDKIIVLGIPDEYWYRDPDLWNLIHQKARDNGL